MFPFLTTGILLGLSAGIAPGPLLALVISETLQHGMKAGIKIGLAPIITDFPIIIITLAVLSKLSDFQLIIGIISLIGGCFVLYLGFKSVFTKGLSLNSDNQPPAPKSLQKGILVNAFSPHPYLFWISVGGPITFKAVNHSLISVFAFIASFYIMLVGSKISLAIITGKSRVFLSGRSYIYTMRSLGILLCCLAIFLFKDGFSLIGWF